MQAIGHMTYRDYKRIVVQEKNLDLVQDSIEHIQRSNVNHHDETDKRIKALEEKFSSSGREAPSWPFRTKTIFGSITNCRGWQFLDPTDNLAGQTNYTVLPLEIQTANPAATGGYGQFDLNPSVTRIKLNRPKNYSEVVGFECLSSLYPNFYTNGGDFVASVNVDGSTSNSAVILSTAYDGTRDLWGFTLDPAYATSGIFSYLMRENMYYCRGNSTGTAPSNDPAGSEPLSVLNLISRSPYGDINSNIMFFKLMTGNISQWLPGQGFRNTVRYRRTQGTHSAPVSGANYNVWNQYGGKTCSFNPITGILEMEHGLPGSNPLQELHPDTNALGVTYNLDNRIDFKLTMKIAG